MSRIFRISGNFKQFGEWSEPDPSFSGKIVVKILSSMQPKIGKTRHFCLVF